MRNFVLPACNALRSNAGRRYNAQNDFGRYNMHIIFDSILMATNYSLQNPCYNLRSKQIIMDKEFHFTIWKEEKYYVAQCIEIDVASCGLSYQEALANVKEALELYLEDADPNEILEVESPQLAVSTIKVHA